MFKREKPPLAAGPGRTAGPGAADAAVKVSTGNKGGPGGLPRGSSGGPKGSGRDERDPIKGKEEQSAPDGGERDSIKDKGGPSAPTNDKSALTVEKNVPAVDKNVPGGRAKRETKKEAMA